MASASLWILKVPSVERNHSIAVSDATDDERKSENESIAHSGRKGVAIVDRAAGIAKLS
jgi:hypothetical protein